MNIKLVASDTKLLSKGLISLITASPQKLCTSPQGRRSLLYLIVPRTRRYFTPARIASLAETDEFRAKTSKKSATIREEEVRKAASEDLLRWIEDSGEALVREPGGSLVVSEVMLHAEGGLSTSPFSSFFVITLFFVYLRQNCCHCHSSQGSRLTINTKPSSNRPSSHLTSL